MFDLSTGVATCDVAASFVPGILDAHVHIDTKNCAVHGTVTGGTSAYRHATGTITGQPSTSPGEVDHHDRLPHPLKAPANRPTPDDYKRLRILGENRVQLPHERGALWVSGDRMSNPDNVTLGATWRDVA